jgi:hypothetical protein
MQDVLDAPILVGRLNKKQGLNGFVPAEVGHPVFEYKDRYLIFLKCLTKTAEQVPDGNGGHTKHMIQYNVIVPYYKKTLSPFIDFDAE